MAFIKGEPRPPNAGRKKGSKNKRTIALAQVAETAILSGLTPLEFMLGILRDPNKDEQLRFDAAKAAAPYCHSRLISTDNINRPPPPNLNQTADELRLEILQDLVEMRVLPAEIFDIMASHQRQLQNPISEGLANRHRQPVRY